MAEITWEQKFDLVCVEVENGRAVRQACPEIMSLDKFYQLLKDNPELAKRYAHACEARADTIFDEIIDIAEGSASFDEPVNVQRDRLKIDARKWVLSKLAPKKYGDKIDVTSDGEKLTTNIINLGTGVKPPEDGTAD